jgi:hypothetical protein
LLQSFRLLVFIITAIPFKYWYHNKERKEQ